MSLFGVTFFYEEFFFIFVDSNLYYRTDVLEKKMFLLKLKKHGEDVKNSQCPKTVNFF